MVFKTGLREDEVGKVKEQTPEEVVNAAHIVKKGAIYDLGTERFRGMPLHPAHPPFEVISYRTPRGLRNEGDQNGWMGPDKNPAQMAFNSEVIFGTMHTGTHIDSLGHITCGLDGHWYNGFSMDKHAGDHGLLKADGSSFLPIFTRGVLIDVAAFKGVECLPKGYGITVQDLQDTLKWEGVTVQKGDTILIHTGYDRLYPDTSKMSEYSGPGINKEAAAWLASQNVVNIGSDTESMEQIPCVDPENPHAVHSLLLIEYGIHIMELLNMKQLANDKVYEFLFVALPLTVRGATGSMINPVAIV